MLDHLTPHNNQIRAVSGLDLLTAPKGLPRQVDAFLLSCKVEGLAPATLKNYQYQLGVFVKYCYQIDLTPGGEVTTQQIRLFLLNLQQTNNPVSVGDYYKTIKRFFNWLIEEGIMEQSPMQNIKPPRMPKRIVSPFSLLDIENLLALCSGNTFLEMRNRAMVLLFLDTGLRLSEMANIQLADMDFDSETIKVMGKGARERVVRMGKTAQKALLKYLLIRNDNYPCLWVSEERRPLTRAGVQTVIKKLCQRAQITDAKPGPHTFRHTAAIHFLRNGGTEFTLQLLLGHSTLKMTRGYVSTLGEEDMIKAHRMASPVDNLKL